MGEEENRKPFIYSRPDSYSPLAPLPECITTTTAVRRLTLALECKTVPDANPSALLQGRERDTESEEESFHYRRLSTNSAGELTCRRRLTSFPVPAPNARHMLHAPQRTNQPAWNGVQGERSKRILNLWIAERKHSTSTGTDTLLDALFGVVQTMLPGRNFAQNCKLSRKK